VTHGIHPPHPPHLPHPAEAPPAPVHPLPLGLEALAPDLSAPFLEHHAVLPLERDGGVLVVGSWGAAVDPQVLDDLALLAGCPVRVVRVEREAALEAVRRVYGEDPLTAEDLIAGMGGVGEHGGGGSEAWGVSVEGDRGGTDAALDDLVALANEAPVVKLVNLLLLEALEARASDVHLETYVGGLRVRYRVDGVLQEAPAPPRHLAAAVVSRLKIMAELDIAERRVPQDGRIRLRMRDRQVDVRVATLPTLHGESVVLRLLDRDQGRVGLEELGMPADTLARFVEVISRPHGIVLSTGPTGSGKTTTLYAAVDTIRTGREKIVTVEDPVEYELPGVPQVPVNPKVGLTFATALRALLRQDPDVILVGEIRDQDTADIATHAALTGHLVLSTLHTNDAATALTRLVDLGVERYLVASTVEAVLAQRLVRRICSECTEPVALSVEERTALGVGAGPETAGLEGARGRGCEHCRGTGYRGRTGIFELLVLDDDLRIELDGGASAGHIERLARERGMRLLREDGLRLVLAGRTTPEEVLRVTAAAQK
jgi:general secretion pathway protein E